MVNAFPSGARHLLVHIKCFGSQLPIVFCTKSMSRDCKQVFHRAVNRQESLRLTHRFEAAHRLPVDPNKDFIDKPLIAAWTRSFT